MSTRDVHSCDRCNQEYDPDKHSGYIRLHEGTVDLCQDCTEGLREFLKVGRK